MLYPAFVLPLFFRFNVQKGKMVLTAINGIGVGVIGGFLSTINLTDELFGSVTSGLSSYIGVFLIIAAVVVILFTVSCLISVKIYEKRDL